VRRLKRGNRVFAPGMGTVKRRPSVSRTGRPLLEELSSVSVSPAMLCVFLLK
jgi:hypothetical protein